MRFTSGVRLGPFEILAPLGAGGMGEVYRARDTRLDRTVAIKLLPSELVSAPGRRVERFRHEARAIARITHPNICTLHDIGEDGSAIFLVMEYVEGATLARRLEDGPLPLPLALRTAIQIADALDHAHRHGVVHRDLKPGNIMLTRDSVKLLDFGLAKLKERDEQVPTEATKSALTDAGTIVGTVPYMAPEQIEGHEVDARTDIFSFGVVLYEMVCGRRPFAGDSRASLMAAIVAAEPPALSSLQPRTPASLERLILRCLAKDPDDRWQTARDLAAELRWIAETGSGATTAAPGLTRRPRRAALWGGVAGAVLTAAVFAATVPSMWPRPAVAEYRQVTYRKGVVSSARFTPDGQSFVYSASWEGQPYAAFLGRPESPDARDLQLEDARILSISRAGDMAVLFGPQNIAQAFGVRTLARIPMAGGARRDVLTGVVDADWIPGTDALAVIRDPGGGRPWTVEFPAGTTVHEARAAWSLRVSPDGSRVAFFEGPVLFDGAPEAMITVIDKSGQKSTLARDLAGIGLAWAPSGSEIWFTAARPRQLSAGPQLRAVSLSGVERTVYSAPDWLVLHDISADGRVLLSRNTIRINVACQAARGNERARSGVAGGVVRQRTVTGRRDSDLRGWTERPDALREPHSLSPKHGWFSRGLHWRGPRRRRVVSGREMGARRAGRESGPPADGGRFDGDTPKGRSRAVRTRRVAQRLEAHCLHGRHWRRQAQRLHSGDPGRSSSCDYAGWRVSRWQSGGARRQLRPRSRRRHVDALSDSRRRWPAGSGAQAWRYPASMEPRRPIRVYGRQRQRSPAASR